MAVAPILSATEESQRRVIEKMRREFGPQVIALLHQRDVLEISLNPDGKLWVERAGQPMEQVGHMAASQAEAAIGTVAAFHGRTSLSSDPILECELPITGSRFEGLVPPVVARPTFSIRRHASSVYTLAQYVEHGIATLDQVQTIQGLIAEKKNLIISGGTSSGKTTLGNAVLSEMVTQFPARRRVVIEDTVELQCSAENIVFLRTSPVVDMVRLLRAAMRLRPDSIDVGEVRGPEALALLKAWNTGHPGGFATVHANSANAALIRLEHLVLEGTASPTQTLIAEAVDAVVGIEKTGTGRRVTEVVTLTGFRNGEYVTKRLA